MSIQLYTHCKDGQKVAPAPEIAFQAAERGEPMVNVQSGSLVSDQLRALAQLLVPKA